MGQNYSSTNQLIIIGSIGAPFRILGWVKVNSYTDPKENLLKYNNWLLVDHNTDPLMLAVSEIKESNGKFLVLFASIQDRNQASLLTNKKIAVTRDCLPKLATNQYYWEELIGCSVYNLLGQQIGIVDYLFSIVANDVMVVKNHINNKEYLIPYSFGNSIININKFERIITVDWSLD